MEIVWAQPLHTIVMGYRAEHNEAAAQERRGGCLARAKRDGC